MGAIIAGNIFEKLRDVGAALCYPGLVKRLCERAGVPMHLFANREEPHFTMDPPIPVPEGIEKWDPQLFVQMPTLFEKDEGTSEYDRMQPKVWPKRTPKPSYLVIKERTRAEEIRTDEAGPSVPVPDPSPAVPEDLVPAIAPVTTPVPAESQTVSQPLASQPKRRLEPSEGSRSARKRKHAPQRVKSTEEVRAERERAKKAAFASRFNVVERAMSSQGGERQAREAETFDMTIPAGSQEQPAEDVAPSPLPTLAQATAVVPPSDPSSQVPTAPTTQQDLGAVALQLIQQMMETQRRKEEEERLRRVEEAQEKERRRVEEAQEKERRRVEEAEEKERKRREKERKEQEKERRRQEKERKKLEEERKKFEEEKRQEEIRKEELRKLEEATQAEIKRIEEVRREEMRLEREARARFEAEMNKGLQQTTSVLAALFEKVTTMGAVPITGPIPPSQQALPSRAGEGTSGTGTTVSDTPANQESDPSSQSQRSDKEEADKSQSAD